MGFKTRGLRGSTFEEMIDLTNRLYAQQKLAIIQKVPTPITPIAVDNAAHTITNAYFEKKSTVDFIGVAQGLALCFDAKETRQLSLPLRNIHEHQIEFMENFREQKGVSFLLVHFLAKNEMYLLPGEVLAEYKKAAKAGGRKSIPFADFDPALIVKNQNGFPVHYLVAVNAYLDGLHAATPSSRAN
ncbi:MAG: Holliday junction resolvase RecU [Defluviitaleaceae bacterium]|nr:Holliday junction resolvase RecU [Defluviitaleaceae bacterium]MCL2262955.1 Holliday junction resolvase RecU [Defluviitaleaceae bacterium]